MVAVIKHACIAPPVLTALLLQAEAVSAVDLPQVEVVLLTDAARNHASGITNPSNTLLNPYPQSKGTVRCIYSETYLKGYHLTKSHGRCKTVRWLAFRVPRSQGAILEYGSCPSFIHRTIPLHSRHRPCSCPKSIVSNCGFLFVCST